MKNKLEACQRFFYALAEELKDRYEVVGSCNADCSAYLIPNGTIEDLSYYGKPDASFRISDHWNWYSNIKKCSNPRYIQCLSVDAPWARKRIDDKATKPVKAIQVSLIFPDGKYHAVYGEVYDRETKTWSWLESVPSEVAAMV